MLGQSRSLRLGLCSVLFLGFVCCVPVAEAMFFDSLAGFTADLMRRPLESFSLLALKSYLLGHVGGRVTQYRQMMYGNNGPYAAAYHRPLYSPRQGPYVSNSLSRGRRSVDEEVIHQKMTSVEKDTPDSVQFLEIANKLDTDKCIPRLVCEVMVGSRVTQSGQFEDLVVSVLGNEAPETKGDQKLFSSVYHYAAFAGKQATSLDSCQDLFPKCKASEADFRKMADKIFAGIDTGDAVEDDDDVIINEGDDEVSSENGDQTESGERQ